MEIRNRWCASAVLTLALSFGVYAGDMQTPTIVQPPPPIQTNSVMDANIACGETTGTAPEESTDDSTSLFLEILLRALSLY